MNARFRFLFSFFERTDRERSSTRYLDTGSPRVRRTRSTSWRAAMCVMNLPAEPRKKTLFASTGGEDGKGIGSRNVGAKGLCLAGSVTF
jgi:hypothetical protein